MDKLSLKEYFVGDGDTLTQEDVADFKRRQELLKSYK